MGRRLLDHDPMTGVTEWFIDNPDGTFTIAREQNVDSTIERVKMHRNALDGDRFGDMAYVGSLPLAMHMALPEDIRNGNDQKGMQKFLIENNKFMVRRW